MPQLDFLLSANEERRLVSAAFEQCLRLVPDADYDTPRYVTAGNLIRYCAYRARTQLFFILADDYVRSPLEFRCFSAGPKPGRYFIMQRNGGPTIDLRAPSQRRESATSEYGSGFADREK